jgi:hypothetical protein
MERLTKLATSIEEGDMPKPDKGPIKAAIVSAEEWDSLVATVNRIDRRVAMALGLEMRNMAAIDDLQSEVSANTDLTGSVVRLVDGLADQLEQALQNNDTAAVQAVVDQMRSNNQSLAQAVANNTQVNPQ